MNNILEKNINNRKIILASKSPRRQELLTNLGLKFETVHNDIPEVLPENNNIEIEKVAEYFASEKANYYNNIINEDTIIICADTIVVKDNAILHKPKNAEDARNILNALSNGEHKVITGVCIRTKNKTVSFSSVTKVYFKKLNKEMINYYIENYNPYDKAGSYGIQEWIGYVGIEKIEGSFYNVMGLPTSQLFDELLKI